MPKEILENTLFQTWSGPISNAERDEVIRLILGELKLKAVRTNQTKHGNVEIQLQLDE